MTDDKHVRVVPTTRTSKLKEPVGVVTIEVDYVLDEKNSCDIGELARVGDLNALPIVLNVIEIAPQVADLGVFKY